MYKDPTKNNAKRMVKILKAARETIATPERWYNGGQYAVNASNDPVMSIDPAACRWCLMGAIGKAAGGVTSTWGDSVVDQVRETLRRENPSRVTNVANWNDSEASHEDVLALIDKTIERLEKVANK